MAGVLNTPPESMGSEQNVRIIAGSLCFPSWVGRKWILSDKPGCVFVLEH